MDAQAAVLAFAVYSAPRTVPDLCHLFNGLMEFHILDAPLISLGPRRDI